MANRFEKGKHIYFLFKEGFTVQDSQLKPRYYLSKETAEKYLPRGDEIIEYAPVQHGRWSFESTYGYKTTRCSRCFLAHEGHVYFPFCPYCGAKMDRRVENVHCIGHSENAENAGR